MARTTGMARGATIASLDVSAYTIPTATPESDGTMEWEQTTLVLVELTAGSTRGLGYTYADTATARLIHDHLAKRVIGQSALDVPRIWWSLVGAIRNLGRPGVSSMAISAVDCALWDLKARLLEMPLVDLLGRARDGVPIYGSGGFTSYSLDQLRDQLGGWVREGIPRVKMKVGREPERDVERVRAARDAIGPDAELFVDGNGAYSRKQALELAEAFAGLGVSWFEEPVSSDDLEGLRLIRDRAPAGMEIAAGEYGYDLHYFRRMLEAGAVDVLQADMTRCGGVTGFLAVGPLCVARSLELSAHCGPSLHAVAGCASISLRHLEYFYDHQRIEGMLFDGVIRPERGELRPDSSRPGFGLEFKHKDAERYRVAF